MNPALSKSKLNTQINYDLNQPLPKRTPVPQNTLVAALKHFTGGPRTILIQISLAPET